MAEVRNSLATAEEQSHCSDIQARYSGKPQPLELSNPSQPDAAESILAVASTFWFDRHSQHSNYTSLITIRACSLQLDSFSL